MPVTNPPLAARGTHRFLCLQAPPTDRLAVERNA